MSSRNISAAPRHRTIGFIHSLLFGLGLILLPWSSAGATPEAVEPVIEVAAFGVTPVSGVLGVGDDTGLSEAVAVRVVRDETWPALVKRLIVDPLHQSRWLPAIKVSSPPELRPGRYLRLKRSEDGVPVGIEYLLDARTAFDIRLDGVRLRVTERLPGDDLVRAAQQDELKSSLFAATDAVGLPESIALQLVEIFGEQVDFFIDLRRGYRCAIVYEMAYADGMPRPGRILAAEFSHGGRRNLAFFHRFRNGESGYFDVEGSDVNRVLRPAAPASSGKHRGKTHSIDAAASFRRSPLEFSRITSAPAKLRFHPILKQWRAHRGTDYAAPVGTKVKATADGEVFYVGSRGSYGNLVILRHYGRFTSFYGHLNGFASGLSFGDTVRKGDVIGYVGMTGLATGPHLHYELRDDLAPGAFDTPLVVRSIPDEEAPDFKARISQLRQQLDFAYRTNQVLLE